LILAERGIAVTHESIGSWRRQLGSEFARKLRRRRPKPGDIWRLDEVFLRINGVLHYLWRGGPTRRGAGHPCSGSAERDCSQAVPQAPSRRPPIQTTLAGHRRTEELRRGAARIPSQCSPSEQPLSEQPCGEFSQAYPATRAVDAAVQVSRAGRRFLSAHSMIYGHFRPRRHLVTAGEYRRARAKAFRIWRQETCA
jgi:putative transposase